MAIAIVIVLSATLLATDQEPCKWAIRGVEEAQESIRTARDFLALAERRGSNERLRSRSGDQNFWDRQIEAADEAIKAAEERVVMAMLSLAECSEDVQAGKRGRGKGAPPPLDR